MSNVPPEVAAVMGALQFGEGNRTPLRNLGDADWGKLFKRWEVSRLLVPLVTRFPEDIRPWVASQVQLNLLDNAERFKRIQKIYAEFSTRMHERGGEHLVIKGFALSPDFVEHPKLHLQSDIDVYCPKESLPLAIDSLSDLGYRPTEGMNTLTSDHAPTMLSTSPWTWKGNPYDPEIPASFEVHFRFWNEQKTRLRPAGLGEFWERRIRRRIDDFEFPALDSPDHLGYIALNCLRDILSTSSPTIHLLYFLAQFIEASVDNDRFWSQWLDVHHVSLRRLEVLAFVLAQQSFNCRLPEAIKQEVAAQPKQTRTWFALFNTIPLESVYKPDKSALWLHLSILKSASDRRKILFTTLFPTRIPSVNAHYVQHSVRLLVGNEFPLAKRLKHTVHLARRSKYHLSVLPRTLYQGARFHWSSGSWNKNFVKFLAASFFYNIGMYMFFLIYNLYLADRGFHDGFIGTVVSAATLGSVVGTLPAGLLLQRLGLKHSLSLCIGVVAIVSALRSVILFPLALLSLAFLAGFSSVIWAVALSPLIAEFSSERERPRYFSAVIFWGIGLGILGGFLGGRLPSLAIRFGSGSSLAMTKQWALLVSCGIVLLGLLPLATLRLPTAYVRGSTIFSVNPFILRFLFAIAAWSAAAGAFAPFFTLYFSRHWHLSLQHIGLIDSLSHVPQLIAIASAPWLFRKLGLLDGTATTQIATALALGALSYAIDPSQAVAIYVIYVAFQWMAEPSIFTMLMNNVEPHQRAGASALTFLVASLSQSMATMAAGAALSRFGYPVVLRIAACLALAAAFSFRVFLGTVSQKPAVATTAHLRYGNEPTT